MAWGTNPTEEELEKLAAVRAYFQQTFPGTEVRDSYDPQRLAQVFRIETDQGGGFRDAVVLTALLDDYPTSKLPKLLADLSVADHLRAAKGTEVLVTSWGVEEKAG
jgi:hypothetical protein